MVFSVWDWLPVILYILFLIYIGLRSRALSFSEENFILSGRRLTLPAFVATLVSTWYGGILGVGEFSYLYGISNWVAFGFPYYVFALIFALFLVKKLRKEKLVTLPEIFLKKYDKKASILAGFFVYLITNPAPYIFMAAVLLQLFLPVPLWASLLIVIIFSSFYLLKGGFSAVVKTDILQFIVMFAGFLIILPFAWQNYGGFDFLHSNLPEQHLTATGGNSWFFILVWFWLALITLVDPNFYQRCFAAKNNKTARNGILISVVFWLIFDIMTTMTGLYARAALDLNQPYYAYPALANQILPPLFKGLFITSLLATIMSSLDSFTFSATISLSRDIWARVKGNNDFSKYYVGSLTITLFSAFIIALLFPSVIDIWYVIANVAIPPLIFPILIFYWTKFIPRKSILLSSMFFSFIMAFLDLFLAQISGKTGSWIFPGMDPIYVGFAINLILYGWDYLYQKFTCKIIKR